MLANKKITNFLKLDDLIKDLWKENNKRKSLDIGILLANEIMHLLGIPRDELEAGDEVLDRAFSNARFKNQKMEKWFEKHPYFGNGRIALKHYNKNTFPVESNFYQLNESATKARISAISQLTSNWEDSILTMLPDYNIGIDFLLNSNADTLSVIVSKEGNLRVLELSEKLSKTQIEIFNKLLNSFNYDGINPETGEKIKYEPQRTIHTSLWNALELKEVNKKFYIGIANQFELLIQHFKSNIPNELSTEDIDKSSKIFASRLLGRIIFLWFLRKKNIINEKVGYFDIDNLSSNDYYTQKLKPLFFEILNKPAKERGLEDLLTPYLNGGLFEVHKNDWANYSISFPENWFHELYDHMSKFNFTTDESSPDYELIAIDPEMLGRVFENLLATIIPETSKTASLRKNKGAFYTPREIVSFMCRESLKEYIKDKLDNSKDNHGVDKLIDMNDAQFLEHKSTGVSELWGNRSQQIKLKIIDSLNNIKIFDPACGSGAFPMGMLQLIIKTLDRLTVVYDDHNKKIRLAKPSEKSNIYKIKLFVINKMLFGSDIEPMAVEITRLRSWLSLIIDVEDSSNIEPLPNLDFNFVCANSLIPLKKIHQFSIFDDNDNNQKLVNLKERFFLASTKIKKDEIKKEFIDLYNSKMNSEGDSDYLSQLKSWNPFDSDNPALFFDIETMFSINGFDIVIGNPPYIGEKGNRNIFNDVKKSDFGKRTYLGKMDYYYFFIHLGISLLNKRGILSFITTNYYPTADGAKKLRKEIYHETTVLKLINFNQVTIFDSAKGQHDMITFLQKGKLDKDTHQIIVNKDQISTKDINKILQGNSDFCTNNSLSKTKLFTSIESGDFYIRFASNSNELDSIISKVKVNSDYLLGDLVNINQGIISGADKFTKRLKLKYPNIDAEVGDPIFVFDLNRLAELKIQKEYFKPFYKNSDIHRWVTHLNHKLEILYLNADKDVSMEIMNHLEKFKPILIDRREFKSGVRDWYDLWWPREEKIFNSPKIIAPQRSKLNTFAYNDIPWYSSADVYYITAKTKDMNLLYLLGILNSFLMYFWLYHRGKRKGEMLELYRTPLLEIPIVIANRDLQKKIIDLTQLIIVRSQKDLDVSALEKELNDLVYNIYDLSEDEKKSINDFIKSKDLFDKN